MKTFFEILKILSTLDPEVESKLLKLIEKKERIDYFKNLLIMTIGFVSGIFMYAYCFS